jgi:hypothetical protein
VEPKLARYIWQLTEPYHSVVYFAPDAGEVMERAGFKGGWMGYFAGRSGPMGAVGAEVVTATFYNFHPNMVARAIPDAWRFSSPDKAVVARMEIADNAIRTYFDPLPDAQRIAELLEKVMHAARPEGRPLFAGNAALPPPDEPHMKMWWACTALREHRGDGHVVCLTHADIDGCEAHVLSAAVGAVKASTQKKFRGWSDEDWSAAVERLATRGIVEADGSLTTEGLALKEQIEADTDRLAAGPYASLSGAELDELIGGLEALMLPVIEAGAVIYPNPMGLTAPQRPS